MKKTIKNLGLCAKYAVSMLTKPAGTTYELEGRSVNRFTYTWKTTKWAWNMTTTPAKPRRRTWKNSRLRAKIEDARWHFFAFNPAGEKILAAAQALHDRHPESAALKAVWLFCLPF